MQTRDSLRNLIRQRRQGVSAGERLQASQGLADHLMRLDELAPRARVAGYWATGGEISLHAWLIQRPDIAFFLPCLQLGRMLRFAAWRVGDPLQVNRFGIPEPDVDRALLCDARQVDVILVPLLGFDRHGARLGMGGGYYDRTCAFRRLHAVPPLLVGVAYHWQEQECLPAEEWDVPMDVIATDRELIRVASSDQR